MTAWIKLCKEIQKRDNCSYKDAIRKASSEYMKPQSGGSLKTKVIKELDELLDKTIDEKRKSNLKKQKKNLENLVDEEDNKEEIEGGNLKYLISKRDYSLLPKKVRTNLKKFGKEKITSLIIVRTPIEKAINGLLLVITGNKYNKAVKSAGYDTMFHLALFINNKYLFDKQEVVHFERKNPIKKNSETRNVPITRKITIEELVQNTKTFMGNKNFNTYDAFKNNCQDFIIGVLEGNRLGYGEFQSFVKQDADAVLKKLPKFTQKISKALTDVGAVAEKVIHGSSVKKPNSWIAHVKECQKKHGCTYKEALIKAKKTYKNSQK